VDDSHIVVDRIPDVVLCFEQPKVKPEDYRLEIGGWTTSETAGGGISRDEHEIRGRGRGVEHMTSGYEIDAIAEVEDESRASARTYTNECSIYSIRLGEWWNCYSGRAQEEQREEYVAGEIVHIR
jgi:hypothetical protein